MATEVHPLLRKDEPAEEEVNEQEAPAVEEPEALDPQAESDDEEQHFIRLDRRILAKEFDRLQKEDKEAANALNSLVGQKARREWKPKLDELQLKLAEVEQKFQQSQTRGMTPDQVKERLYSDPEFRNSYGKVVDPQALQQKQAVDRALETAHEAVASVLTEDEMAAFRRSLDSGYYDYERDETGKPVRVLGVEESLSRYNRDLTQAAMAKFQQGSAPSAPVRPGGPIPPPSIAPPPVAEKPKAAPNPKLARSGSPDLSQPTTGSSGATRMSVSEYKAMNWKQRAALIPDYEQARKAGIIYDG